MNFMRLQKYLVLFFFSSISFLIAQGEPEVWVEVASLPSSASKRAESGSFTINGKGYIFGGTAAYPNWLSDCWEYDPVNDSWRQMASIPLIGPREPAFFTIGNKGYAVSGYYGSGSNSAISKNVFEFDPVANTWTKKADFAGNARRDAIGFSIGSKGYVGTGAISGGQISDLWEYDPSVDKWTKKANFPGNIRDAASAFSIGTKGYITLGRSATITYNDLWEYDPSLDVWTKKANFPGVTRSEAVSFVIYNEAFVGSGHTSGKNDFWAYNQFSDTWRSVTSLPGLERVEAVGFAIGEYGYLAQGYSGSLGTQKDLWKFVAYPVNNHDVKESIHFMAYPNPTTGRMIVDLQCNACNEYSVDVLNNIGERVLSLSDQHTYADLDLSFLPAGIYFVRVYYDGVTNRYGEGLKKIILK